MPGGGSLPADLAVTGHSSAAALSATFIAGASSIGLAMQNATANQQRAQVVATATLSIVLTRILTAPLKTGAP